MRTFEKFPENMICPICLTNNDEECWLMPIDGTEECNIFQARPVNVSCTGRKLVGRLRFNPNHEIIYAFTGAV